MSPIYVATSVHNTTNIEIINKYRNFIIETITITIKISISFAAQTLLIDKKTY